MNLIDIDWNDPNLQIGAETEAKITAADIRQQICRAQKSRLVASNSGQTFDLVIEGDPESKSRLTIHTFHERDRAWILNPKKPDKWRFIASPLISWSGENPIRWGEKEIIEEMGHWPPPEGSLNDENRRIVGGHYSCLRVWLSFYSMSNGAGKDDRREHLFTSEFVHLKPYSDLSRARREFCRQLFPWSELAQRAGNEDHLWLCLEYSACLAKLFPDGNPGKVENRKRNSNVVRSLKQALKTGDFDETLTIGDLQEQGEDWRLGLEDCLLQDAIRLAWESEAEVSDLEHHINQYLNALAHFNAVTGHREIDVILRRSPGGEVSQTRKGQKLKSQPKSGRGRGRPPKSNIKFY
jgi:hypothetical protein